MSNLDDTKNFVLQNDLQENRQHQLYVEYPVNGTNQLIQIVQTNGSNPKIRKVTTKQINQFLGIYQKMPQWTARIIKDDSLTDYIKPNLFYYISFDEGATVNQKFSIVDITESDQQNLSWTLLLTKVN